MEIPIPLWQCAMKLQFNYKYGIVATLILCVEIFIALKVHDSFIRPFVGDCLVVILIYTFIKTFTNITVVNALGIVLGIAILIEFTQLVHLTTILGLKSNNFLTIILGNTFSFLDIGMYLLGGALVLGFEFGFNRK